MILHLDKHLDNVEWMWAVLIAGFLPVILIPMTNDADGRIHLLHLKTLLAESIVLTTNLLRSGFEPVSGLDIHDVEDAHASLVAYNLSLKDRGYCSSEFQVKNQFLILLR